METLRQMPVADTSGRQKGRSPSVPGSAWDRTALQALPAIPAHSLYLAKERQSLSGSAVPGRAWDRV
jgi:hypothetical protein